MRASLACALLLQGLSAALGKYVYISSPKTWLYAQEYCRNHYTDLAPVSVLYDFDRFYRVVPNVQGSYWIGLMRNPEDKNQWMWSGGGRVFQSFWGNGENNNIDERNAWVENYDWQDIPNGDQAAFVCFKATVVMEKKTWEGALEHCRKHYHDLASVASRAEMLLIQKELEKNGTTGGVWTGLRMMKDDWLWTDGQPLEYQAWGAQGRPTCPTVKQCGALQMKVTAAVYPFSGNNTDASTQQASSRRKRDGDGATLGSNTNTGKEPETVSDLGPQWEWAAEDCAVENYFVCY